MGGQVVGREGWREGGWEERGGGRRKERHDEGGDLMLAL